MKIRLNVSERLRILQMLHRKGTYVILRVTQKLIRQLSLTEAETKEYEFAVDETGTQCRWNEKGKEEKEFDLPDAAMDLLRKEFKDIEEKGELDLEVLDLFEKICNPAPA